MHRYVTYFFMSSERFLIALFPAICRAYLWERPFYQIASVQNITPTVLCQAKSEPFSLNQGICQMQLCSQLSRVKSVFMIINSILLEKIPFSLGNLISKRSCLINYNIYRQFKSVYKFDTAKKLLEKFKRERELELYKSRIITVPNVLTISRLTLSPLFPWLIMNGHPNYALGLLAYCGVSDIVTHCFNYLLLMYFLQLDGWIARRFNQKSVIGSILDPVADKTTVLIFTSSLLIVGGLPRKYICLSVGLFTFAVLQSILVF